MNLQNFETVFFKKQTLLFAALKRQNKVFEKYVKELKNYPDFTKKFGFDFNLIHDLETRIETRIQDLQGEYHNFHFEKYGFNSY